MDGFKKAGLRIGHAINCGLLPWKSQYETKLESELGKKPREEDYEDDNDYEKAMDRYNSNIGFIQENFLFQTLRSMNIFDNKHIRDYTLSKTKRPK